MSLCEIPVLFHQVGAYPDNLCIWFAEFLKAIAEGTNLSSAARCLLSRLTIQRRSSEPQAKCVADGPSVAHSHPRFSGRGDHGSVLLRASSWCADTPCP